MGHPTLDKADSSATLRNDKRMQSNAALVLSHSSLRDEWGTRRYRMNQA